MEKKDFTRRLLTVQYYREIRKNKAEEQLHNNYTAESCIRSMDSRRKYLNGKRCY